MKELKRSRTNRMLAGVCGGIGDYFDIDPTLIRLLWVVITVFTMGAGILAYLLAWLIIPEEAPSTTAPAPAGTTTASGTPTNAGTVLEIEPDQNR